MATLSATEFVRIIRNEIGIDVHPTDLDRSLDDLAEWDSVHLLTLAVTLERYTASVVSLPELLQAQTLGAIHEMVS